MICAIKYQNFLSFQYFIGPHVVFTNDYLPRAKIYLENPVETYVLEGASIGANATILCGITIGSYAMIGAGAVVTRSVPDYTLVYGNPASNEGYVCECGKILNFEAEISNCECGKKYSMAKDGGVMSSFASSELVVNGFSTKRCLPAFNTSNPIL